MIAYYGYKQYLYLLDERAKYIAKPVQTKYELTKQACKKKMRLAKKQGDGEIVIVPKDGFQGDYASCSKILRPCDMREASENNNNNDILSASFYDLFYDYKLATACNGTMMILLGVFIFFILRFVKS
jgi:hypothetical protein